MTLRTRLALTATAAAVLATSVPLVAKLATPTNLVCMQTAVEKRDNAIIAAWDTFSASMKSALTTRRDALKAGWAKEVRKDRRTALHEAWRAYKNARKAAREAFRNSRNAAWNTFRTEGKACKGVSRLDEGANEASELIGL